MIDRPTILVRSLLAAAAVAGVVLTPPVSARQAAGGELRVVEVVARRYAFEPAEVEVAEGETVRLLVRSADGLHGFEIKQFKVKKEIPRGADAVAIEFTATSAGRFPILCSEYCGDGHADMKGMLVVTARATSPSTEAP
jgi:cytochrome c oxidase subunit 2